jgi:NAD(P)-dependent dehydrogenase (short-subunit alcohol dehydrogenase family)
MVGLVCLAILRLKNVRPNSHISPHHLVESPVYDYGAVKFPLHRDQQDYSMQSFGPNFKALIIGASGGIGNAMVQTLQDDPNCATVVGLHRSSSPAIDFTSETSLANAAGHFAERERFNLIVVATGLLHTDQFMPEKKLSDLNYDQLATTFQINTFGPALAIRHFAPLLDTQRSVFAVLSAKVGSIGDNRLGGWYSYRASKAALNMLIKTAAIEVKRSNPNAVLAALHPGTVNSRLSKPFKGETLGRSAIDAGTDMLNTLDQLTAEKSGGFFSYDGQELPW